MSEGIQRVVLVSGPSGAGRSTAINALEDLGFESIDNIPLSMIPRLIEGSGLMPRPMALGIDVRNREFSAESLLEIHAALSAMDGMTCELFYLDCSAEVLTRRFSETRRRHPLAPDEAPSDGIARELILLEDVRRRADVLIDTADLTVHDLRAEIDSQFGKATEQGLALSIHSFSYKRGLPQGLDMALDCRFLRNPHWEKQLRAFTGLDAPVAEYVAEDARFHGFTEKVIDLLALVLPGCVEEGKAHFSVGFGCTGGQHRSVAVAESVAAALAQAGWRVSISHRELERLGLASASTRVTDPVGKALL